MSQGPPPPPPGYYPAMGQPDQSQATTALVLGILGVTFCFVTAPFAWAIGRSSMREIDASGGALGGRSKAQAGYILGIVGTVLVALGVLFFLILVVGLFASSSSSP